MSTLLINPKNSTVREKVDVFVPGKDAVSTIALTNDDVQPILKPVKSVIDVVHDFSWYSGPKASPKALDKLPCAFLIEREQKLSSLVAGALYYLRAPIKGAKQAIQSVAESGPLSLLGNIDVESALDKGSKFIEDLAGGTTITKDDFELLKNHNLTSLEGIYLTAQTGFNYRLPFYDTAQSVTNQWGDSNTKVPFQGIVQAGTEFIENASSLINVTQPGVYIEKPKYFQQGNSGESKTIKFPLINTIRRNDNNPIQQNFELLWLLTFQNKAYKTSFARTPPPKLYTVSVPGQFSMPYAYISNMSVNFLGTVRRSPVSIPILKNGRVTTTIVDAPIPDAYDVSITFTSLIGDYGNAMMSDAFNARVTDNGVVFGA